MAVSATEGTTDWIDMNELYMKVAYVGINKEKFREAVENFESIDLALKSADGTQIRFFQNLTQDAEREVPEVARPPLERH